MGDHQFLLRLLPSRSARRWLREGIGDGQPRKAAEVGVTGHDLTHTMLPTERDDVRIMHQVARRTRLREHRVQQLGVASGLRKEHERWGAENGDHILSRRFEGHRRMVDAGMRDHAEELVHARPRDGPRRRSLGQGPETFSCRRVTWARRDLGIDEDVRVDRNHVSGRS